MGTLINNTGSQPYLCSSLEVNLAHTMLKKKGWNCCGMFKLIPLFFLLFPIWQTIFEETISIMSSTTLYYIKYNEKCDSAFSFGENEIEN